MRTITYTYDETKPTNKDYLISVLADDVDDGGASYESLAKYDISCPYYRNSDCYNEHCGNEYDTKEYKEGCVKCKMVWLEREYDTYPSDDGKWEVEDD